MSSVGNPRESTLAIEMCPLEDISLRLRLRYPPIDEGRTIAPAMERRGGERAAARIYLHDHP